MSALGLLPWYIAAFVAVRLRDYMGLYQSYDDNLVIDRLARLAAAVGMAPVHALQDAFETFLNAARIRRHPRIVTEDIEV